MPLVKEFDLNYRFPFSNGHFNTIYPFFFRPKIVPEYNRERFETSDGDFIDLDWIRRCNRHLVILLHGLEGSSLSQYICASANHFAKKGFDICAFNHRSCSGELNRAKTMYHSGFTRDLDNVITKIAPLYDAIYVVGFSLGGNMILKYLGEGSYNFPQQLKFCLAFSVPADLATSSVKLTHWSNIGYTKRFLKSLSAKMIEKAKSYPEIDLSHLTKMKELMDFDEHYTSKLHGFNDAQDYYARSNCKQFLHNISIPALLINAIDDPFLTKECLPYDEGSQSDYFHFLPVTNGGHVGFTQSWGTFSLETLLDFGFKLLA